jgi:hypothetical protein
MGRLVGCENCGGALPEGSAEQPFVVCAFCGATTHVADSALVAKQRAVADDGAIPEDAMDRHNWARKRLDALAAELAPPVTYAAFGAALREMIGVQIEAGHAALGKGLEDVDQVMRIAFNLARDYCSETGAKLDGIALARLVQASIGALEALRTQPEHEINLPFIYADSSGPKHLCRTVDTATIAELAARQPVDPAPPRASQPQPQDAPEPATAPQPKSFWRKLFG